MFRSLSSLGLTISAVAAASLLGIGAGALTAPQMLARNYGIPVEDAAGVAYVRGLGVRDAAIGLMILAFLARGNRPALATTIALCSMIGASDFVIVATTRGPAARLSLAIHGSSTIGLVTGLALLQTGP